MRSPRRPRRLIESHSTCSVSVIPDIPYDRGDFSLCVSCRLRTFQWPSMPWKWPVRSAGYCTVEEPLGACHVRHRQGGTGSEVAGGTLDRCDWVAGIVRGSNLDMRFIHKYRSMLAKHQQSLGNTPARQISLLSKEIDGDTYSVSRNVLALAAGMRMTGLRHSVMLRMADSCS